MFSCKSRSACGRAATQYSDSDEDSSYGFKTAGHRYRTRAAAGRRSSSTPPLSDDEDYHIYGNVTFGYKPILKTRLSSAASSIRRRSPAVKRTVSFSGVESPVVVRRGQAAAASAAAAAAAAVRPPPPCYSVAVRRASSFSTTRRNAAAEIMMARRRRMPLPDENARPLPPCNTTRVVVDVHRKSDLTDTTSPPPSSDVLRRPAPLSGLDKSPPKPAAVENVVVVLKEAPNATDIAGQRMDSYRFSMANLEDTQDVDLDAVLGELCALESQYQSTSSLMDSEKIDSNSINRMISNSNQPGTVVRTDSPDNDSAFSDCVSLLSSSESSASSGTTNTSAGNKESSKAEKIRLALQKMKEASVKKLFIKVFNDDGGAKSLLVDEGMRCSYVMRLLADKHHINLGPRWGLVEHLPDLHMERVYEEHELLVDNLMLWTRDSKNRLLFVERPERTLIFENPSLFNADNQQPSTGHATGNFAQEYFCNGGLPSVEGPLYIKTDSRKGWKKYYSVLRASGLYYYKDKVSRSPKDLVCLSTLDVNQVYYGVGWKKKYKAPTEYCLAIKHPCLQQPKSTKYIKYVCAEDQQTLHRWMSAIRIVKYGQQLLENYETALAGGSGGADDSGSSGQLSALHVGGPGAGGSDIMLEDIESGLSDSGSSSGCDVAFESDYPPCGTIKRKPPKLPLTATTRQLTCSAETTSAAVVAAAAAAAAATAAAAAANAAAANASSTATLQKPVKSVKFADHHYGGHHHHHSHPHQQQHHHNNQNQLLQHYRTPSMESLPPPPPELLMDDDEPNDQDIMSDVPPPPPKLLSPPSTAFLADLHRVVRKKWQVAQKCKSDTMATPHEVLGFRDPAAQYDANAASGSYSREDNVSNWVAEHYGPNNLYENVCPMNGRGSGGMKSPATAAAAPCSSPPPPPPPPNRLPAVANAALACAVLKKRPPPPPPPRSEKTQLSTVVL